MTTISEPVTRPVTLYVYDHCPFCVRARMPLGLKSIPHELVFLPNDDEATPIGMIGRKMLPILEDGAGFTAESLDIVARLDERAPARMFGQKPRDVILSWIERWDHAVNGLVIPRTPDPVFPEFARLSSRQYFTRKKEESFGAFSGLLERTGDFLSQIAEGLEALVPVLPDPEKPSMDDIVLFPVLRSLTILPDLLFPAPVERYLQRMAERSAVPLVSTLRERQKNAARP
ncbi:glutaredoxin 2 [Swaminathania salitolerans]|uniref:Glutaredoxin 2 n=1 Tax=Swaminathania salitolerans TaxID=182838 RepID=A0A511BKZ5_9PROT|nr:glutaredoxin 2 [Swaminathania salitolerans]GBQ09320.1 glutaredoxin [Swaminathania salitolerans LMG 21291]GEL01019.1 glutaredoxin 2 [Swaminathania salitolerans]